MNKQQWRKGDIVQVEVHSLTYEGQAVGRLDGMAVFIRGALPGDAVQARLTRIKQTYAEAEVTCLDRPSPWRVPPRCHHFGVCGGCVSQDLSYDRQLSYKTQHVRETLQHIGGLDANVQPALGMADPWRYRNKMEFAFGEEDGQLCLGLMRRGSFDRVTPIVMCHLTTERAMQAVRTVEAFASAEGLPAVNPRQRTGSLRHLVVREGLCSGDLLLNLVSRSDTEPRRGLAAAVAHLAPTGVLWSHNDTWGSVVRGDRVYILAGQAEIVEHIGHLALRVGPFSFLQTNSQMVEVLYRHIEGLAALSGKETVLDLYCGVGAIGLFLARGARRVVGYDVASEAIAAARRNAESNGIGNCVFERAEVEALSTLTFGALNPQIVILDPPRAGLHPRLVQTLRALRAPRLIYVSCNPATLARDLKALQDVYSTGSIQPIDMFPHTWHIESVVCLTRKG